MAFIAPKHEGALHPRTEVNKCHTSRGRMMLYPVGMATIATLEDKRMEKRRGYRLPLYAALSNA